MFIDIFSFIIKLNVFTSKTIEVRATIHSIFVAKLIMSTRKNISKDNFTICYYEWSTLINLFKKTAIVFVQ